MSKLKTLVYKIIRPFLPQRLLPSFANVSNLASIGREAYLFKTTIGDFTYLASNVTAMNTTIGKFCSIGQGVCISLGMHPTTKFVSTHPAFFSTHKKSGFTFAKQNHFREMGKTIIGNDVWIGVNAIIMDDIIIGDGSIIGAGAVVTKNIPSYAIAVGNPAKVIKYRFQPQEIEFLLNFKWWDRDRNWIDKNYLLFHDIETFIAKFS